MATSTGPIRDDIDALDVAAASAVASLAVQAPAQASGYLIPFHIDLAAQGDGDIVTDFLIGHKFELIGKPLFVVSEVLVGSTKTIDLVIDIGATPTTGGVTTVLSADATLGTVKAAAAAFSALNTGSAVAVISVRAANATAFTTGKGTLYIRVKPVA